ncbi:GTP-binding protein [Vibrio sp.]|nr:GTP-binding protein [Vibrio sp.]
MELRQREEEESVITTMVLNDDRPFHPQRLWQTYLEHLPNDVYRSKGFFYLPTRDSQALMWNQSGASIGLEIVGH